MPEIWAILEHRDGILHENSAELLAELAEVAQRQQAQVSLCALVLTSPDVSPPDTALLSILGVQNLYLVEHPLLADYTTEGYVAALAWLIQQRWPLLVATSATANGRDWTPRLAARLGLPYVPGCLGLDLQDDNLFALRSVYEGRAYIHTRTTLDGRTALAALVPGVRGSPSGTQEAASLTITRIRPETTQRFGQEHIRRLAVKAPSPEEVELEAADRNAPIFALADLGLLGDANQVLPLAARLLEERSPRA